MRSLLLLISISYVMLVPAAAKREVGCFVTKWHNIQGKVSINNPNQLLIENFNYDGQGAGAGVYFNYGKLLFYVKVQVNKVH